MDNQSPIIFQKSPAQTSSSPSIPSNPSTIIRAKSFKVNSPSHNFAQYINTIKAYALAGMPFEHIANAGDYLGDRVDRGEIDAPLKEGGLGKIGEIIEDESKIMSWQNRGEVISIVPQLASPTSVTGQELIQTNQSLTTNTSQQQTRNVLEGIAVYNNPQPVFPSNPPSSSNSSLENNPYLQTPPIIK